MIGDESKVLNPKQFSGEQYNYYAVLYVGSREILALLVA